MDKTATDEQPAAPPLGLSLHAGLGPLLEDAASDCLSALAGVGTYDVNLPDHNEAWAAIGAFAAKVRAAERERWATAAWLAVEATPEQLPLALDALADVLRA